MLSTKTLLTPLSALFAKVHHPPPIDKRESQRLLNALTTSFRKNLDKEHGYGLEDTPSSPLKAASTPKSTSAPELNTSAGLLTDLGNHDHHRRPTDSHVRAILSNPLFSYDPSKTKTTATLPADRDPMDVFDQAVAKGLMSLQRAAGVLVAKRQAIAQSASISVNESIAASGTALRVLQWLRASGLERDLAFVECQALVKQLIPFMVEEGFEEVAWNWLERLMLGEGPMLAFDQGTVPVHASYLLSAMVRAKVSPVGPLNNGYASILRAGDMFRESRFFRPTAFGPWRVLSLWSTVHAWQHSQPSEPLFDAFTLMSQQLQRKAVQIDEAHLALHHPVHPDATLAVKYLQSDQIRKLSRHLANAPIQPTPKSISTSPTGSEPRSSVVKRIILMATDAVQHLTRTGQDADAEWVENTILGMFGDFVSRELGTGANSPEFDLFQGFQRHHGSTTTS